MKFFYIFAFLVNGLIFASAENELPVPVKIEAQKTWLAKSKKMLKRDPSFSSTHRLKDLQVNQKELNKISHFTDHEVKKLAYRPEIIHIENPVLDDRVGQ